MNQMFLHAAAVGYRSQIERLHKVQSDECFHIGPGPSDHEKSKNRTKILVLWGFGGLLLRKTGNIRGQFKISVMLFELIFWPM